MLANAVPPRGGARAIGTTHQRHNRHGTPPLPATLAHACARSNRHLVMGVRARTRFGCARWTDRSRAIDLTALLWFGRRQLFGAVVLDAWKPSSNYYGRGESFVFQLRPHAQVCTCNALRSYNRHRVALRRGCRSALLSAVGASVCMALATGADVPLDQEESSHSDGIGRARRGRRKSPGDIPARRLD